MRYTRFCLLLVFAANFSYAQKPAVTPYLPTHQQMLQAYANADRLDSAWKKIPVVTNIRPNWQANGRQFWYDKRAGADATEYYFVNAEKQTKHQAFDTKKMADAVAAALGKPVPANKLRIVAMFYGADEKQVNFKTGKNWLKCDLSNYHCEKTTDTVFKEYDPTAPLQKRTYRWEANVTDSVSPDKQWTAFIRNGNLYAKALKGPAEIQFTTDGTNDKPYGEITWSPDSKHLVAYLTDPKKTKKVYYVLSSVPGTTRGQLQSHDYDQPGDEFTSYQPFIFNITDKSKLAVDAEKIDFFGAPALHWRNGDSRYYTYEKADRGHQWFRVIEVDVQTGKTRNIIDEKTKTFIYEQRLYTRYLPKAHEIVWITEKDGWRHIYLVNELTGKEKLLTAGNWVVRDIDSVDVNKRQIWFTASGKIYDGWENSGLAGHTLGHYLSAIAMHYASTRDPEFLKRSNYIVSQLNECQVARKTGYVGAIPKEDTIWAEVAKGDIRSRGFDLNGGWSPWYTVHKVMAGLLDAYLYTNNAQALKICRGMANWTGETIKNLDDEKLQKMLLCEYGGMAETLTNLYAITGDKKYLDLSYKFYDKRILDPLAEKNDILPGKHSNTQIPKVIASARRYELTGDRKDKAIADFFWETVTGFHSYATGGNSNYEYLTEPGKLNDKLTENTTETCNTYNMLKLTRHLFAVEPSARLMDYYEKGLYNHILASQNHETGMVCYFVPLRMGGKKSYSTPFDDFTCCVGSGMENHVKYNESIYFRGADGSVYVNLFIPSILNWKQKGLRIKQEGNLPSADQMAYTISVVKPTTFAIRIRKPKWANNPTISINGKTQQVTPDAEGYFVLNRKWRNNDKVTFTTPENLYTEAMPDNANRRAIFYGPVLLAGVLGNTEPDPLKGVPVFVTSETDPNKWLQLVDKNQLSFRTQNVAKPEEVKLIPFNQTKNEYYSVYWDVFTPDAWVVQQKAYDEQRKKQQELEAHTTDVLRIGEMQPERDHNFAGENTTTGEDHQKKWRSTENGGYFTYDMKVDAEAQNTLINTYWGMDNRGRTFDIMIDGTKVATEDLNKYKESRFYDISYLIPIELTKGKQKVSVKLLPKKDNSAGPVYGSRMVKN